MEIRALKDWLEVIGLFSVVASLIFVGLQMKQTHDIALANQYQARADYHLEMQLGAMSDSFTMQLTGRRVRAEYEKFTDLSPFASAFLRETSDEDLGRTHTNGLISLKQMDNLHFQYQAGFLDEESWMPFRENLRQIVQGPYGYTYRMSRSNFRRSYQDLIDTMIEDGPIDAE